MARLILRNVEEAVVQALEERATRNGRSAEAEHRNILRRALLGAPAEDPKAVLLEMPAGADDEDFRRIHDLPREGRIE